MSGENRDTGVAWSFHDTTKYVWLGDEPGGTWFGMGTPRDVEAPIWEKDWSLEPFPSSPRGTRLVSARSMGGGLWGVGTELMDSREHRRGNPCRKARLPETERTGARTMARLPEIGPFTASRRR
jgi:hypothetical protein